MSNVDSQRGAAINPTAASLLGFLYWQPMSGGEIERAVEASVGRFWSLTRSQVYRELAALAAAGLVKVGPVGPRRRQPYKLTAKGKKAFLRWLQEEPGPDLIRSPFLLKFFFGILLPEPTLRRFVEAQQERHRQELGYYQELLPAIAESDPAPAHLVRFAIAYEKSVLKWLDTIPWEVWSMPEHQHPLPPGTELPPPQGKD
ncbi:MAG: PadR family transcriptional regulator [Actinomycetota bacterium]